MRIGATIGPWTGKFWLDVEKRRLVVCPSVGVATEVELELTPEQMAQLLEGMVHEPLGFVPFAQESSQELHAVPRPLCVRCNARPVKGGNNSRICANCDRRGGKRGRQVSFRRQDKLDAALLEEAAKRGG